MLSSSFDDESLDEQVHDVPFHTSFYRTLHAPHKDPCDRERFSVLGGGDGCTRSLRQDFQTYRADAEPILPAACEKNSEVASTIVIIKLFLTLSYFFLSVLAG